MLAMMEAMADVQIDLGPAPSVSEHFYFVIDFLPRMVGAASIFFKSSRNQLLRQCCTKAVQSEMCRILYVVFRTPSGISRTIPAP